MRYLTRKKRDKLQQLYRDNHRETTQKPKMIEGFNDIGSQLLDGAKRKVAVEDRILLI